MKKFTLFISMAGVICCSCTRTVYKPIESVRIEKEETVKRHIDSVIQRDDRVMIVRGDTVIAWRDRWNERVSIIRDTIRVEHTDSISVPYPVEKKLSAWQKVKMKYGGLAIVSLLILLTATLRQLLRR